MFHRLFKLFIFCRRLVRIEPEDQKQPFRPTIVSPTPLVLPLQQPPLLPLDQLKLGFSMVAQPVLIRLWLPHLGMTQVGGSAALDVLAPHLRDAEYAAVSKQTSTATAASHALLFEQRVEPRDQSLSLLERTLGTATSLVQDAALKTFAGSVSAKSAP